MKTKRFNKLYILASILMLCMSFFSLLGAMPGLKANAEETKPLKDVMSGVSLIGLFDTEELKVGDTITDKYLYLGMGGVNIGLSNGAQITIDGPIDEKAIKVSITMDNEEDIICLDEYTEFYANMYVLKFNSGTYTGSSGQTVDLNSTVKIEDLTNMEVYDNRLIEITGIKNSTHPIKEDESAVGFVYEQLINLLPLKQVKPGDKVDGKIFININAFKIDSDPEKDNIPLKLSNGLSFVPASYEFSYLFDEIPQSSRLFILNKGTFKASTGETYIIDDSTTIAGDSLDGLYTIDEGPKTGGNGTHIGGGSSINSGSSNSKTEKGELSNIEICALVVAGILEFVVLCFVGMSLKGKAMLTIVLVLLAGFIGADVALYLYFL